jgi:hypothetical protein
MQLIRILVIFHEQARNPETKGGEEETVNREIDYVNCKY